MAQVAVLSRSTAFAAALLVLGAASGGTNPSSANPDTVSASGSTTVSRSDPVAGERLYAACMGCHSLDGDDVGPRHRGVVGRRAGSVPGYAYSTVLKGSGIIWTPAMLDRWLAAPQNLVPGSRMYFSVAKAQDRADIIAYLAQQK